MAQENSPDKEKRQGRTKKPEKPYVEQIDELLLVHNKNDPKEGLRVISKMDEKGNYQTVTPEEKNENSFLKFDKNSSILENFIKNFWSQLKEPTHFRLIRMTFNDYKQNKQALKDLAEGKKTDAVKEFLKRYEIVPKANNQKNSQTKEEETTMAKKQEQTTQAQPEQVSQVEAAAQGREQQEPQGQQTPTYRYNENMINWEELGKFGISKEMLEQSGQLDSMLKGYKTNRTMPLTLNIPGVLTAKLDARLSFISNGGQVMLGIHGIRKEPELDRPYFGHIFTEEDKKNLRESGNMGRVADLNLRGNTTEPCLISIDKNTNELVAVRQEHVYIPNEIKGITLTPDEIQKLKNGEQIFVEGMKSNQGKEFNANLQYSAERRGIEFIFPKDQAFNQQTLGGVPLSPMQLKALNEGHTILVEDMKRKNGELFSSFVTMDKVTGGLQYTRHNPETGEIYIPKEICSVQLTPEDKEALRKGTAGLSGKHDRAQRGGILLVRQAGYEYRQDDVFTHAERIQRAAGTAYSGGGLRARVHGTGKSEPPGWQDFACRRAEKQRADLQFLPESQSLFRAVAVFSGKSGHPQGHFPPCRTDGNRTGTAAGAEEGCIAGGIDLPGEKQNQSYKPKKNESYEYGSEYPSYL